jgi:N-methylhydantoinase A
LASEAAKSLEREGVPRSEIRTSYQVDLRYHGQGLRLAVNVSLRDLESKGLRAISDQFDAEHKRLFTFALELEHELVTLRAAVQGRGIEVKRGVIADGSADATEAVVGTQQTYMDGTSVTASVYDRGLLKAGNVIEGPAIIIEMDSTTVILPKHFGSVDRRGNVLIYPDSFKATAQPDPKGT